jgi:hypothetical protein
MAAHFRLPAAAMHAWSQRIFFTDDGVTLDNIWIEHGHRWEAMNAVAGSPALVDRRELRLPPSALASRYIVGLIEKLIAGRSRTPRTSPLANLMRVVHALFDRALASHSAVHVSRGARRVLEFIGSRATLTQPVYAVMGHTHLREVTRVATIPGPAVYVNTGTWNPVHVPSGAESDDAAGYRFARFSRESDAYSLATLVWDDEAGMVRPEMAVALG